MLLIFLYVIYRELHGVRNIGLGNCLLAADPFEVEIRCMRSLDPMGARKVPSFPSPAA